MSSTSDITTSDIVQTLKHDHQSAEQLLERFESVGVDHRSDWFDQVRETLVRHEVAEEMAVYPAMRGISASEDKVVGDRIAEQGEAEQLLSHMEELDTRSADFGEAFLKLRAAVLDHAQKEETMIFGFIERQKTTAERLEMGRRYEKAKKSAPTHPHPHAPDSPPGNVVLGPIAALADRIRDAMRGDHD